MSSDESMPAEKPLVLVTGATGFVSLGIIEELLQQGYRVRGTVRDLTDENKLQPLRKLCPEESPLLELKQADLLDKDSWLPAVRGCTYVIQVASPVSYERDESVIRPTVEGTRNVLTACKEARCVRRVVLTGSVVSASGLFLPNAQQKPGPYEVSNSDWINVDDDRHFPMSKSKALAEKAAWEIVENLKEDEKFELVVLLSAMATGPFHTNRIPISVAFFQSLMEKGDRMTLHVQMPVIDIRDVATAHVRALTLPDIAGHRIIVNTETIWYDDMAKVIAKEFKPQGYSVPTMTVPNFLVWLQSFISPEARALRLVYGKKFIYHADGFAALLGREPIDVRQSILDSCYCCIERGFMKKTNLYKGPKTTK